jgi:hypothetical protein
MRQLLHVAGKRCGEGVTCEAAPKLTYHVMLPTGYMLLRAVDALQPLQGHNVTVAHELTKRRWWQDAGGNNVDLICFIQEALQLNLPRGDAAAACC